MARLAVRKTDFGTVILHWTIAALLLIAIATGLRIAIGSPYDMSWLRLLDPVLPQSSVWTWHIPAGTALFALAVSYVIYLSKARLFRRIQPDLGRLTSITRSSQSRLSAVNAILYWIFFLAVLMELGTGVLLYLGFAGRIGDLHLIGTMIIVAYVPAHVMVQIAIGGARQLLRIFNPGRLAAPQPPLDPFELIAQIMQAQSAAGRGDSTHVPLKPPPRQAETIPPGSDTPTRRGQVLQVHPLTVAIGGGMGALVLLMSIDQITRDELPIDEIRGDAKAPLIDGDLSDPIWRRATPVLVRTQQGANLDGEGGAIVEIRAVHDGTFAYFSFVWDDPTRSLKHLPLAKTKSGWRLLHDKYDREDANAFYEDKFAVLLAGSYTLIPGDRTFHAGRSPLTDKPPSGSGRGLHYTTNGSYVDVWEWRASEGGASGRMDDSYFGPPAQPDKAQLDGRRPYKGGFSPDPGVPSSEMNFEQLGPGGYDGAILPKRLPQDFNRTMQALGTINLDPNDSEDAGSRWWMAEQDTVPYSKEADDKIPTGTIIPGVIDHGAYRGDRTDIRCAAKWTAGRWSLEVTRRMDTGSRYDVPIRTDSYLRVAVFDHSQSRHTRHIRPIRIKVNTCAKAAQCLSMVKGLLPNGVTLSWTLA